MNFYNWTEAYLQKLNIYDWGANYKKLMLYIIYNIIIYTFYDFFMAIQILTLKYYINLRNYL